MARKTNVQEFLNTLRSKEDEVGLSAYPGMEQMAKRKTGTGKHAKSTRKSGRPYPKRRYPSRRYPAKPTPSKGKPTRSRQSGTKKVKRSARPRKRK